jgi:hypothetical protein
MTVITYTISYTGNVVVWDMVSALADAYANQIDKSKRHIQLSSQVSDSTVRCISWNGIDKPERLLFGGFDGRLMVLDTNDPCIPLSINRARGEIQESPLFSKKNSTNIS